MSNYFEISGYWKDDKSEFEGYIVKASHDYTEEEDVNVFFFGLGESALKQAVQDGENTALDFVIQSYQPTQLFA